MSLIILVSIFVILYILRKGGPLHTFLNAKENAELMTTIGGILAWFGVFLFAWFGWQIVKLVEDAMSGQFHFIAVFQICAISLGLGTLYEMIITNLAAGMTEMYFNSFIQLLLFRDPSMRKKDIYEEFERNKMINELEEAKKQSKIDDDVKKYFGH